MAGFRVEGGIQASCTSERFPDRTHQAIRVPFLLLAMSGEPQCSESHGFHAAPAPQHKDRLHKTCRLSVREVMPSFFEAFMSLALLKPATT